MSAERLDVQEILRKVDIAEVVSRFIRIHKKGVEFSAICPFHEDHFPSLRVIPVKGFAYCHACQWHGDAIGFVMDFTGCSFHEAIKVVTQQVEMLPGRQLPNAVKAVVKDEPDTWQAICPVPQDAPEFDPTVVWNPKREELCSFTESQLFTYLNADGLTMGHVMRIRTASGKITPQITYCANRHTGEQRWCMAPMPRPRTLYGLEQLQRRPDDKVIIAEGETCKEAAALLWPGMIAISWCGGTAGAKHTDWAPLHGRDVVLWPDNDTAGIDVMDWIAETLHAGGCKVRIVMIPGTEYEKGWDVVNALRDMKSEDHVRTWVKKRLVEWKPHEQPTPIVPSEPAPVASEILVTEYQPEATPEAIPEPQPYHTGPVVPEQPTATVTDIGTKRRHQRKLNREVLDPLTMAKLSWDDLQLACEPGKPPHCNEYNVSQVLTYHPDWKDKLWYDEFYQSVFTDIVEGPDKEWTEALTMRLLMWLQGTLHMHKLRETQVMNAVKGVAMRQKRHHLRAWLDGLVWDGVQRLETFMTDAFGAPHNDYTSEVGRCWLMSMVARVFWPGCQADYMVVLEGAEGLRKSSALNALASPYFAECYENVHGKAFQEHLQGVWLLEIAELHSFTSSSSEIEKVKGIITCRNDRFRNTWGRAVTKHLRQCIMSGTTNRDDWNKSDTGARRFWPVRCGHVNDEYIRDTREQLFAEAVKKFKMFPPDEEFNDARVLAKADWWNVNTTRAKIEQEKRRDADEWEAMIDEWLTHAKIQETTTQYILTHLFELSPSEMDKRSQMRVASCLKGLGWVKSFNVNGKKFRRVWQAPTQEVLEEHAKEWV